MVEHVITVDHLTWAAWNTPRAWVAILCAAPHLFGEQVEAFAEGMRALLASRSDRREFWDWPGDTEIAFARKPA